MPQELFQISSQHRLSRICLIIVLVAAVFCCSFVVRWYLGNTLAEYFNTAENSIDMAQLAGSLSPNDPLPHWRLAQVYQQKVAADQSPLIVAEYEKAVSRSPNDYRYWMSLGTALEQSGDAARGERALRQATALAPAYALPRWYLGNLLLRSGNYAEAFAELRLAAKADIDLRNQLFRLALDVYGDDVAGLRSALGDNPSTMADLGTYLIQLQRVDNGLAVWNSLNDAEKKANVGSANAIIKSLLDLHHYHDAIRIWNNVAPSAEHKAELGRVVDPGFEESASQGQALFGWRVSQVPQLQIGIDPEVAHSGLRSLRLVFQVRSKLDSIPVYTFVPVAGATEYDFEYYLKTEKLQGGDAPFLLILNATDNSLLVASTQAPQGDSDWTRVTLSFKTGEKMEAVRIQLARIACEKDKICPLFGAVWYDDFSIKRRN